MAYPSKLAFTLKRFWGFLKIFSRSWRGVAGVAIILFFVFLTFFAPIITPFNAKGEDPKNPKEPLGPSSGAPEWLRYLPPQLGGNPDLSSNMLIVEDPGQPQLVEYGGEWNFTTESIDDTITVESSTMNYPGSADGCLAVTFQRNNMTPTLGKIKTTLTKEFYFPYTGPPYTMMGSIALLVTGTTGATATVVNVRDEGLYGGGNIAPYTYKLKNTPVKPNSETLYVIRMPSIRSVVSSALYRLNYTTGEITIDRPRATTEMYVISYAYFKFPIRTMAEVFIGDGNITTFQLTHTPVNPDSEIIRYEDDDVDTSEYTINYATGEITLTFAPDMNKTVEAHYEYILEREKNLLTPVIVNLFIEEVGGKRFDLWPPPGKVWYNRQWYLTGDARASFVRYIPTGFSVNGTLVNSETGEISGEVYIDKAAAGSVEQGWISGTLREGLVQHNYLIPKKENGMYVEFTELILMQEVFPHPGKYKYSIEIVFVDGESPDKSVETTVFIDEFDFKTFGTAFGPMGTDHLGRDLFSQLIYGTQASLYVGLLSAIMGVGIGLIVGLASGYLGKAVDEILMRVADMLLVLPFLPLLIVLVAILGASLENLIILMGLMGWMGFSRQVRSQVLSLRERPFIEAAKAVGAGKTHIMTRHILPNVIGLVYVSLATSVPGAIVAEAALSWLGFVDPYRWSWGKMLHECQFVARAIGNWWWVIPPGLCIAALAVAFILLGFAMDDVLNPRLRVRR